jgi:Fe2+ or Zn2+ uptake regulation protein|tara:strand:- start:132 stop:512 length:381 start_codon:yes stop_codon:yes gene_type:complete
MSYSFQKEAILDILRNTENHYLVEEIHIELMKIIPKVSLMTVYRNLNKLTNEGQVFPFHIDNVLRFCGNNKPHYHLHCVGCDNIVDGFNSEVNNIILNHVKSEDFLPLPNGIVIRGFCKNCVIETH